MTLTDFDITEFPEETDVLEGEAVLFHVKVTGVTHQPKLTWYHDGEEVVADYSAELTEDGTLILPSAETKHSGMYKLVAQGPTGRKEREVRLIVRAENAQEIAVDTQNQSVPEPSAIPLAYFANHIKQNHKKNNQTFRDEYEVIASLLMHSF